MPLTPAVIVDRASGEEIGRTESAELMTVGQRRGVLPERNGERRFVSRVDLANQRVEVGRLEDILVQSIDLDASSLTFSHAELVDGTDVLAQWSAHGTPQRATLRRTNRWWLELLAPARPVAAGQTVVFYRLHDPAIVEGAAIVAPS
jgi:tRNA U34 2-thiouridine synthase MnmA/TrmU